uniref:Mucin 2, oligomeric mucus/gel-forming n=1 Tax=Astatotilapia calliptera TaxID=8154 RepID=A0AAX7V9H4_ASTCA
MTTKTPKIVTSGPTTSSTTAVVETTTTTPHVETTGQGSTIVTSKPSVSTEITSGPFTTTKGTATTPAETTAFESTTATVMTTKTPKIVTSGPTTSSTTAVVETTTTTPHVETTGQGSTIVTSKPSVSTEITSGPFTTTEGTATTPAETTAFESTTATVMTTKTPKIVTSGPTTSSTTAVVETTTTTPHVETTGQGSTIVTSKPSVSTEITSGPFTTTEGTATTPAETTAFESTTATVMTTKTPKIVTSGPTTSSTTTVVETTTTTPHVETTGQGSTTVTSKPSVSTEITSGPFTTTKGTATTPAETTAFESTTATVMTTKTPKIVTSGPTTSSTTSASTSVVVTGSSFSSTVITNPSVLNTTISPSTSRGSTSIAPITETLPGSTTVYATSVNPSVTKTTAASSSPLNTTSTRCVCIVNGASHHAGDFVYNVTDGLGWCYAAFCNASCEIETQSSPCPVTPSVPTTAHSTTTVFSTTTKATISSSVPLTTTSPASFTSSTSITSSTQNVCNDVYPPRQNGESWDAGNCTTATCINGKIITMPTVCPTMQQPICTNGRSAAKISDDDGCCPHYECRCVCSVWCGSHYLTFDGESYNFNENCSYYLVKEIIAKYNLTVVVNRDCDPSSSTFCPKVLTVTYKSFKVVLTQLMSSGIPTNVVFVNQQKIYPAYSNSVLRITSTDIITTLELQDISAKIVYSGSSFSIDLPYSLFEGNTEGQCGTCDNSQSNECRSPNGQVGSCSDTAGEWQVPHTPCVIPTTPPTPRTTSKPSHSTPPVCEPAVCDLLTTSLFAPCHKVVPPGPFVTSCVFDTCNLGKNSCCSLEAYATECSNEGICIDWRNATNGLCEHKCPSNKVYMPCGPSVEPTCNNGYNTAYQTVASSNNTKEGCFCPHGTTLFNTVHDICVDTCACVGPDGKPKQLGETWTSDCQTCVCDKDSMSVQCEPVQCQSVQSPNCSEPGQQLVNNTVNCCTTQSCECNVNLCPPPPTCLLGFQLSITNGTCCLSYNCVPKGVCVYNMTEYKPGTKIPTPDTLSEPPLEAPEAQSIVEQASVTTTTPSGAGEISTTSESFTPGPCQECYCGPEMDPVTKLNIVICKPVVCNENCSAGYEYQTEPGKCCGTCVQMDCIFTTPDNVTVHVIEVNSSYTPPNDKCVQYTCEKLNGQLVTKETKATCPPFNPLDCEPGTETTDASGCCPTCNISLCKTQKEQRILELNNCKSAQPVNITYCAGHCDSFSMYSMEANTMVHNCECCQEATTSVEQVELTCADGSKLQHSYTMVQSCQCSKTECVEGTTPKPQRRRRR